MKKHKEMKLIIVTVVEQFEKEILRLFKKANIENFKFPPKAPGAAVQRQLTVSVCCQLKVETWIPQRENKLSTKGEFM